MRALFIILLLALLTACATGLQKHASSGNLVAINEAISKGDLSQEELNGALWEAAIAGQSAAVQVLIEASGDPNFAGKQGIPVLVESCARHRTKVAISLIEAGANINATTAFGDTCLHWAANNNFIDLTEALLEKGANVNFADAAGHTPLGVAVIRSASVELVQALLDAGGDINRPTGDGDSNLINAIQNKNTTIAVYLVDRGENVNFKNMNGVTPLHLASRFGLLELVQLLVERGAIIDARDSIRGTPLYDAAFHGQYEVAKFLLDVGADPRLLLRTGVPIYNAIKAGPIQSLLANRAAPLDVSERTSTTDSNPQSDSKSQIIFSGSAWKVAPKTYITNFHVIEGAHKVLVAKPREDSGISVRVIVSDERNDLAVLESEEDFGGAPLPLREFDIRIGERVFVMGFPLSGGLGRDVKITDGIISARTGPNDAPSQFQITAPINLGNSGGPIIDGTGAVVGVATSKILGSHVENVGIGVKNSMLYSSLEVADKRLTRPKLGRTNLSGEQLYQRLSGSVFQVLAVVEK